MAAMSNHSGARILARVTVCVTIAVQIVEYCAFCRSDDIPIGWNIFGLLCWGMLLTCAGKHLQKWEDSLTLVLLRLLKSDDA